MSTEAEKNYLLGKNDCAIIIKEDLEIHMVMPNLEKIDSPSNELGQAMFLTSFLSYALGKNEWIEEFGKLFESQDPSALAGILKGFEDGVEEYDAVEESDAEENEISFTEEARKFWGTGEKK
jgi:hypothetical protein